MVFGGYNKLDSSPYSSSCGNNNHILNSIYSQASGLNGVVTNFSRSFIHGDSNQLVSDTQKHASAIFGGYNKSNSSYTFVAGGYNEAIAPGQTLFGLYSKVDSNTMFIIGVGGSEGNRVNAFEVKRNGYVYAGNNNIDETNNMSLTTKDYVDNLISQLSSRISILEAK